MDNDAAVQPLAHEYALLREGVTSECAVVGGGLALNRENGVGVGVAVVDDALEGFAWLELKQVNHPLQVAAQFAGGAGNPVVTNVMIHEFQRADIDALPVEPVIQVLHSETLSLQNCAVSVPNLEVILHVYARS